MSKYIIKESELRFLIKETVTEELNEGLGSALWNTAKYATLGTFLPGVLAAKTVGKVSDILGGKDTITGTVSNFFGGDSKTRAEKQRERLASTRNISFEYGRPETVPGWGKRDKLAPKSC